MLPTLDLGQFSGLLPRVPDVRLPETAATIAQNCDFAYGELRNARGGFHIHDLANAAKSLYTEDGLTFYSWPYDVDAVRSPLANDTFNRLYFTTPTDFRVATRAGMSTAGGEPGSSYRVGVPRPSAAPQLSVPSAPPLDGATITATFHYESAGIKYQEQAVTLTAVDPLKVWSVTPPVKGAPPWNTPEQAFPVIHLAAVDPTTNAVLLDVYSSNSSLTGADVTYSLELTADAAGDTYTLTLGGVDAEENKRTRAYVYTFVNTYGEEGPSSAPATITMVPELGVVVGLTLDANTGGYAPIKEIRVYHTPDDSTVADYFYAGSIEVLATAPGPLSWTDNVAAANLNEALTAEDNYPPDPQLVGLTQLPNGILMAWKGNELHFSDPYRPWSWPPKYRKTFGMYQIMGALAAGGGALITTTGPAYFVYGVSPDSMTQSDPLIEQAGVSKWSLANLGSAIVYASHDGIVTVIGTQGTMGQSEQFFTRDVWRARYGAGLDSMRFSVWDGRLIVYSGVGAFTPFMISLDEAAGNLTELPSFAAACSFISQLTDQCYYVAGNGLYQFAGGGPLALTWQSREVPTERPTNFGCMKAVCSGNWQVDVFAKVKDPVTNVETFELKHTEANLNGNVDFRLPGDFLADRWKVRISGTGSFERLIAAANFADMRKL